MENLDVVLKQMGKVLDDKLRKLEVLQAEKEELILMYEKGDKKTRSFVEEQMKRSEKEFEALHNEVLTLSEKVKRLKGVIID